MDNNNNNILFSVIIPVYNSEDYISKCLESITNQNFSNYEIIIIDDGSVDDSLKICREYQNNNPKINIYEQKHKGAIYARNLGLSKANGEYILFVDSDDTIYNNMFLELSKIIKDNANLDMLMFCVAWQYKKRIDEYQLEFILNKQNINEGLYGLDKIRNNLHKELFKIHNYWYIISSCCCKTEFLKSNICENFDNVLWWDLCTMLNCIYNAKSIYFLNKNLYLYNTVNLKRISNTCKKDFSNLSIAYNYIISKFYNKNEQINKSLAFSTISLYIHELILIFYQLIILSNGKTHYYINQKYYKFSIKNLVIEQKKSSKIPFWKTARAIKYSDTDSITNKCLLFLIKHKCYFLIACALKVQVWRTRDNSKSETTY